MRLISFILQPLVYYVKINQKTICKDLRLLTDFVAKLFDSTGVHLAYPSVTTVCCPVQFEKNGGKIYGSTWIQTAEHHLSGQ